MITASLKILGKVYKAEGQTIQEAIINLKPEIKRGLGILTLEKGEIKKERIIQPNLINRLFGLTSRLGKEVALKQISFGFDKSLFEEKQ